MEYKNIAKNIKFEKSTMFGYKQDDVNAFVIEAEREFDTLNKEIKDLSTQIKTLTESNDIYKQDEESIREVILKAQKLAKVLIKDAKAKSERIVNEAITTSEEISSKAKNKAELLVNEIKNQALNDLSLIKNEISLEKSNLETIKRDSSEFKTTLLGLYKTHLENINKLPTSVVSQQAQEQREDNIAATTRTDDIDQDKNQELDRILHDNSNRYNSERKQKLEQEIENIVHLDNTADIEALLSESDDLVDTKENEVIANTKEVINIGIDKKPDNFDGTKILSSTRTMDLQFGKNNSANRK